jgi:hypothetical protein
MISSLVNRPFGLGVSYDTNDSKPSLQNCSNGSAIGRHHIDLEDPAEQSDYSKDNQA